MICKPSWFCVNTSGLDYLHKYKQDMQTFWVEPWQTLLLAERSNGVHFNLKLVKFKNDLKAKCNLDIQESILKFRRICNAIDFDYIGVVLCATGVFGIVYLKAVLCVTAVDTMNNTKKVNNQKRQAAKDAAVPIGWSRITQLVETQQIDEVVATDHSSLITYIQHSQHNNNFVPQHSFNTNYMQQPMQNPKDISDSTTAMDMTLALMAKFRQNAVQNVRNHVVQNVVQNPSIKIVENMNGLSVVLEITNQYGNRNVVTAPVEGNVNDASKETKRVKANCILENNLQQALTSGTQFDKAPVYESDGSAENDSNIISEVSSVKQGGGTVEQHPANVEKTHVLYDSLYNNVAIEVEKVNSVNLKLRETNADLTTELARYKNLEKAAKFVRDFKSLAKEAGESIAKQKALELEIERLLRTVVGQDIMSVVQHNSVVDTSILRTELEQCRYDKTSYDKSYNDMQQKIKRLQAQLGDLKGKSKDTSSVSDTLNPLPQKLKNENVELEFHVQNYEKEIAHLKTAYKNLFDSINVTRTQTKTIINSLQTKLHDTIYENAKLRAQLFDKVSGKKDTTRGTSANTKFAKQSILGKPPSSSSRPKLYDVTPLPKSTVFPKVGDTHTLSKPVTSNLVSTLTESKVVKNDNVIFSGIFRISSFKASRVDNFVPNKHVKASFSTKLITVSQPHVITKNDINSKTNGFSHKDVKSTTRNRRPQPRNNPKNDKSWKVYSVICSTNDSNGENQVVSKSFVVTTADISDKLQQQQDSNSYTLTLATTITADGNFDL
uniref:Uncharacterized protein n=1 Tax=Tanacetum cinerariifolium TaxID=118510 RepID=A0A699HMY1_TANCI|nr:hypothetical protein [Tanacetum cinerariifolium]